jgi:uncharacterized protein YcbK (DUF882 family)
MRWWTAASKSPLRVLNAYGTALVEDGPLHSWDDVYGHDRRLHDLLHTVRTVLGTTESFDVISGCRSPATHEHLRPTRGGGVGRCPHERFVHIDTGRVRRW